MTDDAHPEGIESGATLESVIISHISADRRGGQTKNDEQDIRLTLAGAMAIQGTLVSIFELSARSGAAQYDVGALSIHKISDNGNSLDDKHFESLITAFAKTEALDDVYPYLRSAVQGLAAMIDAPDDKLPVSPPPIRSKAEAG